MIAKGGRFHRIAGSAVKDRLSLACYQYGNIRQRSFIVGDRRHSHLVRQGKSRNARSAISTGPTPPADDTKMMLVHPRGLCLA
jgi:hypothetical protein